MVYAKSKHFKVGYIRARPFVHDVFSFGLPHNLKEFRTCIHILRKYDKKQWKYVIDRNIW